jgi:predicted XRE-type DNA-binding protein
MSWKIFDEWIGAEGAEIQMTKKAAKKSTTRLEMNKGTGNIFADLGFSAVESRNFQLRSQLITALRKFIEREGLTQAEAAQRLGVSQPRVTDLMRGKNDLSTAHILLAMDGCGASQ